jgi:hypothetical protein
MVRLRAVLLTLCLIWTLGPRAGAAAPLGQDAVEGPPAASVSWDDVLARTAVLRGLAPAAEVPRSFLTRQELQARVDEQLGRDGTAAALTQAARLYVALGLLEAGDDLAGLMGQFRGQEIEGSYDPRTGQIYVVANGGRLGPMERIIAAHEYTHALQYQHLDVRRLRTEAAADDDRTLALSALLEGDATWMMGRYALAELTREELDSVLLAAIAQQAQTVGQRLPLVLRESARFPYVEGVQFLQAVVGREALLGDDYGAAVNHLFANPPQSTAEILHPERYLRGQGPLAVALGEPAARLGSGWQELERGVLGELVHRFLVQQSLPRPDLSAYAEADDCDEDDDACDDDWADYAVLSPVSRAQRAAEGWAGDSYALLGDEQGQTAVLVRTRWDDAAEAAEWIEAYSDTAAARYGPARASGTAAAPAAAWTTPDGVLLLAADGLDTVLALAPTAAQAAQLAQPAAVPAPSH